MKNLITIFAICLATTAISWGTTVSISGSTVLESDASTPLPAGSFTSVGYFNNAFSNFQGLPARDWGEVISSGDYVEVFNSSLSSAGQAGGSGSATDILGQELFVWFFDIAVTPVSVNSQDYGLFSGSTADWTAKGDSFTDFNSLQVSTIDNAVFGTDLGDNVSLQAIPEVSSFTALAGFCALGWVLIRRRQS